MTFVQHFDFVGLRLLS